MTDVYGCIEMVDGFPEIKCPACGVTQEVWKTYQTGGVIECQGSFNMVQGETPGNYYPEIITEEVTTNGDWNMSHHCRECGFDFTADIDAYLEACDDSEEDDDE